MVVGKTRADVFPIFVLRSLWISHLSCGCISHGHVAMCQTTILSIKTVPCWSVAFHKCTCEAAVTISGLLCNHMLWLRVPQSRTRCSISARTATILASFSIPSAPSFGCTSTIRADAWSIFAWLRLRNHDQVSCGQRVYRLSASLAVSAFFTTELSCDAVHSDWTRAISPATAKRTLRCLFRFFFALVRAEFERLAIPCRFVTTFVVWRLSQETCSGSTLAVKACCISTYQAMGEMTVPSHGTSRVIPALHSREFRASMLVTFLRKIARLCSWVAEFG
mmetsp:Transcript_82588/g.130094  ORF Transcript_82588/g.130094 Transcript_82588/m.130094 type:complete len:278 (-) Transcript_82588:149-982(-)